MIVIEPGDPAIDLWLALVKLEEELPGEWTLIGAQMVALHGLELGKNPPHATSDADLVVMIRSIRCGSCLRRPGCVGERPLDCAGVTWIWRPVILPCDRVSCP